MCGLAENGYHNAIPTLYAGARFVLCETARTSPQARLTAEVLVKAAGARPLWLERDHHDFLVAFSCKGRGFCPSCTGRRMADTAARLVDGVFSVGVPVRQWVRRRTRSPPTLPCWPG